MSVSLAYPNITQSIRILLLWLLIVWVSTIVFILALEVIITTADYPDVLGEY